MIQPLYKNMIVIIANIYCVLIVFNHVYINAKLYEVGLIIISILKMGKLRHNEFTQVAQCHIVVKGSTGL